MTGSYYLDRLSAVQETDSETSEVQRVKQRQPMMRE